MGIQYNYPVEQLDQLIKQISEGITPMMSPALKAEVQLRYQELQHLEDEDDDDEDYRNAVQKHDDAMKAMEERRRQSHSRDIMILDLTEEEETELDFDSEMAYVRSDPNSAYNLSDEDVSSDAERRRIYKQLQSIGKIYYHAEDYRNAINIIREAIEYSLRHDYPWLTFEQACREFEAGKIKYTFAQLPLLYIDYDTQLTDPKLLAGIAKGEVNVINRSEVQIPKKKKKKKPGEEVGVEMPCSIIGPAEHAEYVKLHQAGYDTPISPILKSCSTIYNRYVMPASLSFGGSSQRQPTAPIDWTRDGAGSDYFDQIHGIVRNPINEIISTLNAQNNGTLRHTLGNAMRQFLETNDGRPKTFKTISTSLQRDEKVTEMENRILDIIRNSNPNL